MAELRVLEELELLPNERLGVEGRLVVVVGRLGIVVVVEGRVVVVLPLPK